MAKFRKIEPIEAVQGEYGFWYANGVFLAADRGDGLAPLGYEPVEKEPLEREGPGPEPVKEQTVEQALLWRWLRLIRSSDIDRDAVIRLERETAVFLGETSLPPTTE